MEHLDVFAVVVEQASLNKASQVLNLSQPALSRKIMKLEEQLGVQLFSRKGKRLDLTRAGEIAYEYALEQRQGERRFMQTLYEYKTAGRHMSLTIGASLTTLQTTLPELVTMYLAEYPSTDMKALTGKTHEIVMMVKEKKVDIGLVASSIDQPGLACEPLFDDHLCLVLPQGHPYLEREELSIADLNGLSMILFSKGTWYRVLTDELFHRFFIFPDVKMEIDSFEAIMRLVVTCQAATLLPRSYLHDRSSEHDGLCVRELPELMKTPRTTSLIFVKETHQNEAVAHFIRKAKAHFAGLSQ
ncbi:LysR family transcriptional regulator [Paenibacillus sp. UNC499MF]|uniref:LysR family transcriptional regulator n=1 Tax=unclassified Paenibacillus TaxID=185978 RepID=UPI0008A02438|nr:LysR family transcriptional regulator [Paenibacillus sp. UNC499MF]SEG37700.1 DNA-binding transcriptional regulator, LysR family [Paenibacillus sp. UNC499MF]